MFEKNPRSNTGANQLGDSCVPSHAREIEGEIEGVRILQNYDVDGSAHVIVFTDDPNRTFLCGNDRSDTRPGAHLDMIVSLVDGARILPLWTRAEAPTGFLAHSSASISADGRIAAVLLHRPPNYEKFTEWNGGDVEPELLLLKMNGDKRPEVHRLEVAQNPYFYFAATSLDSAGDKLAVAVVREGTLSLSVFEVSSLWASNTPTPSAHFEISGLSREIVKAVRFLDSGAIRVATLESVKDGRAKSSEDSADCIVRVYDLAPAVNEFQQVATVGGLSYRYGYAMAIHWIAIAPDGNKIAMARLTGDPYYCMTVDLFAVREGLSDVHFTKVNEVFAASSVGQLSFSPDSRRLGVLPTVGWDVLVLDVGQQPIMNPRFLGEG